MVSSGKLVCSLDAVMRSLNTLTYPKTAFYVHFMREVFSKAMLRGAPRLIGFREQDRYYPELDIFTSYAPFNPFVLLFATEILGRPSEAPRIILVNSDSVGRRLRLRISSFHSWSIM